MGSHPLAFMRLPFGLLTALDSRTLHFWMQPTHFLVRLLHILSMAGFFGIVLLIDLGLLRRTATARLRVLAEIGLPWLHGSFAVAFVTGIALFFYDPVHVGSHGYFVPKLVLLVLALVNTSVGHRRRYGAVLYGDAPATAGTRGIALLSILLWTGVVVCACLNTEAVPKVFLR
jgi:hypothetical protein